MDKSALVGEPNIQTYTVQLVEYICCTLKYSKVIRNVKSSFLVLTSSML